jgi:hypothetical protein
MSWVFQERAAETSAAIKSLCAGVKAAGVSLNAGRVLLAVMAHLPEEADELSVLLMLHELARESGLSQHQVKRAIAELTNAGLIVRRQDAKRAGVEAITTILPAAFPAVGLRAPTEALQEAAGETLPRDLFTLLCGQPASTADRITSAWLQGSRINRDEISEGRGGDSWAESVELLLERRAQSLAQAAATAAEQVQAREEAEAAGYALVETENGTVPIDVKAFESTCPSQVPWAFIHDVIREIQFRDRGLVTMETLPRLIAEAAYSRSYSPFCRGLGWQRGVWALGGQMAKSTWGRPRKIWDDWYRVAERSCRGAALHH